MSANNTGDLDHTVLGARLYEIVLATSATARGEEVSRGLPGKPRLGLSGVALQARVRTNTFKVARVIVQAVAEDWPAARVVDAVIAATHAGFPREVSQRRKHRTGRRTDTGTPYGTAPHKLAAWVGQFKRTLARTVDGPEPILRAAWAEYQWDNEGHPLADGCGRTAKAISAWVLVRHSLPLPHHPSKEAYSRAMAAGFKRFQLYYHQRVCDALERRGPRRAPRQDPEASSASIPKLKKAS